MAYDLLATRETINRLRRLIRSQKDRSLRAKLETLLAAEEAKLPLLEENKDEMCRKIKRWRDKAEELRVISDQTDNSRVRVNFRRAIENYETLAYNLEKMMSDKLDRSANGTA